MSPRKRLTLMVRTNRGSMTVWSPPEVHEALDDYRADVLREAQDATVTWLHKKAGERRAEGPQYAKQADLIDVLASKAARGAIRVFLEATTAEPVELVWRPQDIELGDDDSAHLMLTTDTGAPAILRLSPEQRRALRDNLADEGAKAVTEWAIQYDAPEHGSPDWHTYDERANAETVLTDGQRNGFGGHVVTRTTTRTPWRPAVAADGATP
jgi:hypothetical protein